MLSAYSGKTVREIVRQIPRDQLKHMSNVGVLVRTMTEYILECNCNLVSHLPHQHIGRAAFYHDIGKVCIPPELLSKPGKLDPDEVIMLRGHTLFAQELFYMMGEGAVLGMPEHLMPLARDSAVYHHEWWNGQGYPFGIGYEEIPILARITSVCDAYDAMTSTRAYRASLSHQFACEELERGAGTQFDPELVKIFLDQESVFAGLFRSKQLAGSKQKESSLPRSRGYRPLAIL